MATYRTDVTAFGLDQLDFVEGKLLEACNDAASQKAAVIEAAGAIPPLRQRLWAEDRAKATLCAMFRIFDRDWWSELEKMERKRFLVEAEAVLDPTEGAIVGARRVLES